MIKDMMNKYKKGFKERGFSLIELIVAVVVIGIITFMVVPNLIKSKKEIELSEVITRVQALNMAMASYALSETMEAGRAEWRNTISTPAMSRKQQLFDLLSPYLSYRGTMEDYIALPYSFDFPAELNQSVVLSFNPPGGRPEILNYE